MRFWTNKEDRILIDCLDKKMSRKETAELLNRSVAAVTSRIYVKNLGNPGGCKWKSTEYNSVLQAYRDGIPLKVIAYNMNTTHANIRMMIYNARKKGLVGYRYNVRSVSGSQCQN